MRSGTMFLVRFTSLVCLASHSHAQVEGWVRNPANGLWYGRTSARVSWRGAESIASAITGRLAVVRSAQDVGFLDQHFMATSLTNYFWLGLRQDLLSAGYSEPSGGWVWSDGSPLSFTQWCMGSPNDSSGLENFVRTRGPSSQTIRTEWEDDTCVGTPHVGSGGPGGNFDWFIDNGEIIIFNTANGTINGYQITFAPNSDNITQIIPTGQQTIVGGLVDVNDFYVENGGLLKVEGPNPFTLMASGRVVIRGRVDVSGTSNQGVNTLNVTNIPEPGAPGQAGGGKGGTGSPLTTASSPRGTPGFGAFGVPGLGGQGGETGWSNAAGENARRGGGGGGGVLGRNEFLNFATAGTLFDQRRIGYDAEPGFDNSLAANGAISGPGPARGGSVAQSPFRDANSDNNFFGSKVISATNTLVLGELARPWAGSGGGAGGDASHVAAGSFPGPWNPAGDEKGAGGAGGGGSVQFMALGPIVFGSNGQLLARGGVGGGGENTIFLNRVGGGSGGGSGGHVVLQSAQKIDFTSKAGVNFDLAGDVNFAIDCRGGQGGAGAGDLGGGFQSTTGQRETLPSQDACPVGYPTTGTNACRGEVNGAGGDGGPGIVQLITPRGRVGTVGDPLADILIGPGVPLASVVAPPPLHPSGPPSSPTAIGLPVLGHGIGLLELASDDCNLDGVPDRAQIPFNRSLDADGDLILDACQVPCYVDADYDGFGVPPTVYIGFPVLGFSALDSDCDDANAQRNPSRTEVCDVIDNDCDGQIDEGLTVFAWFEDRDGDGYGNLNVVSYSCSPPMGFVSVATDCDDNQPFVNPGAQEICDGLDNDCNGTVDDGYVTTYCTAGTSVHGCVPSIDLSGFASTSLGVNCQISVVGLPGQRQSTFFYGFQPTSQLWAPFSTSFLCVAPPTQRLSLGGTGGSAGICNGARSTDFNAWIQSNPTGLGAPFVPGQVFHAQCWYRDPAAPAQTNLSNAVRFTLCN
jgi:hypothetical protein